MSPHSDFSDFTHENAFLMDSHPSRLAKWIGHWEIWKEILAVPGDIVEVGVHKGASLMRWLTFREMTGGGLSRRVYGFDVFGDFPESDHPGDRDFIAKFVDEAGTAASAGEVYEKISAKGLAENCYLLEGNVETTVPDFVEANESRRIALLHVDIDTYGPTKLALERLAPLVHDDGLILLDDYGKFPGETDAWDEFNSGNQWAVEKSKFHTHVVVAYKKTRGSN